MLSDATVSGPEMGILTAPLRLSINLVRRRGRSNGSPSFGTDAA
jgi:hypothetical protein